METAPKAPPRKGQTPRKPTFAEKMASQGKRLVQFAVPLSLWAAFMRTVPAGKKPNDLFTAWLRATVESAEKGKAVVTSVERAGDA